MVSRKRNFPTRGKYPHCPISSQSVCSLVWNENSCSLYCIYHQCMPSSCLSTANSVPTPQHVSLKRPQLLYLLFLSEVFHMNHILPLLFYEDHSLVTTVRFFEILYSTYLLLAGGYLIYFYLFVGVLFRFGMIDS